MPGPRLVRLLLAVALWPCTGCITLYEKTEVVRAEEQKLPVRFESGKASYKFHEELKRRHNCVEGTWLGVPFVTFYRKTKALSENAFFNEQVRTCDTDQDSLVTEHEALVYAGEGFFLGERPGFDIDVKLGPFFRLDKPPPKEKPAPAPDPYSNPAVQ